MNRLALRATLLGLLCAAASCDTLGSDLKDYRDVSWTMTGLNGRTELGTAVFGDTLDSYTYVLDDGTATFCDLHLYITTWAAWGWVEDMSGRIVAVGPARDGRTYIELQMIIYPQCTHSSSPVWSVRAFMTSEIDLRRQAQEFRFAPLVLREGWRTDEPVSAATLAPIFTASLTNTSLGATIDVPLTLSVRHWTFSQAGVPQELIAEVEQTVIMHFTRYEGINRRSSP